MRSHWYYLIAELDPLPSDMVKLHAGTTTCTVQNCIITITYHTTGSLGPGLLMLSKPSQRGAGPMACIDARHESMH